MTGAPQRPDPAWLDRSLYPFSSHWFSQPDGEMHYIDEGEGPVVVIVHGNPSWSFEHRLLIRRLSKTHRVIVPDHMGFGLSDKPAAASYLPQWHAANLTRLMEHLQPGRFSLVVHDWGGPVGLAHALDDAGQLEALIVYNSWFWSVKGNRTMEVFSGLIGGPIGRALCRHLNFFPRVLLPASMGKGAVLTPKVHAHYQNPFPTPESRKGAWVFPGAIIGQSNWLESLWRRRAAIRHVQTLLVWGMEDKAFDEDALRKWEEAFPKHQTLRFPDVGHMVGEELGDRALDQIETFLADRRPL